jgi:GT2 family glycosyltransferase
VSAHTDTISVIIITHNSQAVLAACLRAVRSAAGDCPVDVVVVDNASDVSPEPEIRILFPDARFFRNAENRGFGAACNQAAEVSGGDYLLFLNPDVVADSGSIARLYDVCSGYPDAGLVSGRMRFPNGDFQPTCREFPTSNNMIFSRGSALARLFGRQGGSRYTLPDYDQVTEVPAVAGTMVMISKALFERAGGFDTRFFMFMEDTDLSLRLAQAGKKNLHVPDAGGVHAWGTGAPVSPARRRAWHHYAVWQYFLKHQANGFSLILLPFLLLINWVAGLFLSNPERNPDS